MLWPFWGFLIILFQNILFLKEFLAYNGYFGLFTKFKKGSGTSFWCTFLHDFRIRNGLYLIVYHWTKFQCHTFFLSQDVKQNVSLSSYLDSDDFINFKIYLGSTSKAMSDREKKMEDGNISEYLGNEKSFLDKIKNIFHSFGRAIVWWKIKIW